MEAPLEIRYAGVIIGRAQEVRNAEGDALSFFIPVRDPMPVGTVLHIRSGEQETPVRVVHAVETTDAAACGMQVRTIGEAEVVTRDFIPPPAIVAEKPAEKPAEKTRVATPTPVVEVDLSLMNAESAPAEATALENATTLLTIAAPAPAPEAKAAEAAPAKKAAKTAKAAPAQPTAAPVEVAAVPEAVPVTVGSSMTGALRNATESVQITEPSTEAPTVPIVRAGEPASPQVTLSSTASYTREYGSVVESASEATESSAAVSGEQSPGGDLPPARPIAGPSGRRKTKRRK